MLIILIKVKDLKLNIEYFKVSRNPKDPLQISYEDITNDLLNKYTIIVNCSPVGTFPNINDKPKSKFGSGFLGGIGSDVKAGGDVGFCNKIGRAIGSAFGQMADDTIYPKNLEMHFNLYLS